MLSGSAVYSKDLQARQEVKTLQGQDLLITSSAAGVIVNGNSKVTTADIAATNGVVHIVDTLLIPRSSVPELPSTNDFAVAPGNHDLWMTLTRF